MKTNVEYIRDNTCPCCLTKPFSFYEGPSGGMCTNVECATCESRLNICSLDNPFVVDILSETDKAKELAAQNTPAPGKPLLLRLWHWLEAKFASDSAQVVSEGTDPWSNR
ncbi:MAG: hypothetical protein ACTHJR_12315 [Sphingomonas sp.]|uniref:hypothetical protein n=1 Tax=Sphingomonas sp. TaxID=28214 RepID=UPI003F800272